jgi:hypothetical protein
MANDQKNEQSVMLSLEDILSQDPQLNGNLLSTPLSSQDKKDEIDLSALQRIGAAEREEFVAPTNISNMAYQPIQLKEKKTSPVLKGLMLLLGALGLIVGGIYLGEVLKSKLGKDQLIVSQNPQTPQIPQTPQTPQTPQQANNQANMTTGLQSAVDPNQVVANNQTANQIPENPTNANDPNAVANQAQAVNATATQANPQETAENKTDSKPKDDDKKGKTSKSKKVDKDDDKADKPEPKAEEKPEPKPEVKAEPKPEEKSAVNDLLKGLKNKNSGDSSSSSTSPSSQASSPSTQESSDSSLPEKLEGRDVLGVIRKNTPNINRCKSFAPEQVKINVRVIIVGSGDVQSTEILDPAEHKSSELGKCLEEKIKSFKFPQFSNPNMSVKLPFSF